MRALLASALVTGLVITGATAAQASGVGGGGVGGGGGGGSDGGPTQYWVFTGDQPDANGNPQQGWGQASIDYFASAMEQSAKWGDQVGGDRTGINSACGQAINDAIARGGGAATQARVIQVGTAVNWSGGQAYMGWGGVQADMQADYENKTSTNYWQPNLPGYSAALLQQVHDTFQASVPATPRIVCVALNDTEAANYNLSISTDKSSTFSTAGASTPVSDAVHASPSTGINENLAATATLTWGGVEGNPKSASKNFTMANNGTTATPLFTPADFGWTAWPAGNFWFDVSVPKQGRMNAAVSVAGQSDPRESWSASPAAPTKVITTGTPGTPLASDATLTSGMFYNAQIAANTNGYTSSMTITDTIGTDKVFIGSATADDATAAYVLDPSGNKVAGASIAIDRSTAGTVKVSGTVTGIPAAFHARVYTLVVPTYVLPTPSDYTVPDTSQVCYTAAQTGCIAGNSKQVVKVTPAPDKVWVLDPNGGLTAADPGQTNQQGADNKVFLMGDAVSAVVNGRIPGKLGQAMTNYQVVDDWTQAAPYVDFTDPSQVKVYAETAPGSGSYVSVTDQFTIKVNGTVTTATAQPSFLATTKGLSGDLHIKLVVTGSFRKDFSTGGNVVQLTNAGSEVWNNQTVATNTPPVYTWTPNPNKHVLGSADESGDKTHADINGTSVWPGQKLEYSIGVDLRVPTNTAYGVKTLAVLDVYDPYFTPDKTSIEFWDSRGTNPQPVPRSAYTIVLDPTSHTATMTFTPAWIAANVSPNGGDSEWLTQGWLTMRFTGTVNANAPEGSSIKNQAFQIINGASTGTSVPTVQIPTQNPDKESLSSAQTDINGKTVVKGDIILYRLTLDANPARAQLAYNVHKLGMVDTYDSAYLSLDPSAIKVTEKATGNDVTAKFNVQVTNGTVYVFAKTVDTPDVYGGPTIPGNPQPSDLAAFDQAPIRPLEDPIIDQTLLGQQYWVTMPTVVTQEVAGHVIQNTARQNIQNTYKLTRTVSNPLAAIDPSKDVVVSDTSGEHSVNQTEVHLWTTFNYRLNSSEIPANRAYAASQWSLTDAFDKAHDQYTGVWAVYANTDIYNGSTLEFAKGSLIQDSTGGGAATAALFNVSFDETSYTLTATPTQAYLDLIGGRGDLSNAFAVYTQMERIAPADKITNTVQESYNGVARESNVVWTMTKEYPALAVQKYTLAEGTTTGVHRDAKTAYAVTQDELASAPLPAGSPDGAAGTVMQKGVQIGIRFSNTGDTPLTGVKLLDFTQDGQYGDLEGLVCAQPASVTPSLVKSNLAQTPGNNGTVWVQPSTITELALGQTVDCQGTVRGLAAGMSHADTAVVTAQSVFTQAPVKSEDVWFAKVTSTPGIGIVKYTLSEGPDAGNRNDPNAPYVLSDSDAKNGVKVAFNITNTGDEPLSKVAFTDATQDGTTGTVTGIQWLDPAAGGAITLGSGQAYSVAADGTVTIGGTKYTPRPVAQLTDLAVGKGVLLVGTLTGMKPGSKHTDVATVTATALYSGLPLKGSDPWNAELPGAGAVTGTPITRSDEKSSLFGSASLLLMAASVVAYILRRRTRRARTS
ncbi:LPXTG cell wall anchor domain-containing protein [Leifsonia sp. NPDC058194]|uniref:LPXTG cell wall anchor domain-containing protein n=1 Tax=Leifsonia sp. NPDC058194 TaxID=3346374 RepID=UPI0036D88B04